jgi:hypothetical protein
VIISTFALQKVPIFAKLDVKAMAQQLASNPISTMWGPLTVVSKKVYARPHICVWKVLVVTSIVDEGIFFPPNMAGNKINVFFVGYIVQFLLIIKIVKTNGHWDFQ